jgi:hypothetical protein
VNYFFKDGKVQTRNMNYLYFKNVTLPKVVADVDDVDSISFDLKSVYIVPH